MFFAGQNLYVDCVIMKYQTPNSQNEVLPNLPGLTTLEEISLSEFEGFLQAEIILTEELTAKTKFNLKYILNIHKLALGHLYSFAGKYRDVNLSKGGFPFAAARFLPETMNAFQSEILSKLPGIYNSIDLLISDVANVHAELLFIHPFREGNGRTARVLANLMVRKQGFSPLKFEKVGKDEFELYIAAVQKAAGKDYKLMEEFVRLIFPG